MDPKAYERVKHHIAAMHAAHEVKPEPPPPPTNTRQWAQARMRAKQREIDEIQRLAAEPKTWSGEEQEAVGEIVASSHETRRDRQSAINLMLCWKLTRHANLLVELLENPHTDFGIRYAAAWTLGGFGRKEILPLIYNIASSVDVPPEAYYTSLYDVCVQAMFFIAAEHGHIDKQKYDMPRYPTLNATCRQWWNDVHPTEQMILAWSRGEGAG